MSASTEALLAELAAHAIEGGAPSRTELDAARLCLLDALACIFAALRDPDCARFVGPVVPGATMTCGARVPGTSLELDPVQAAFNLGALIRWHAACDARLARACHPADALGALLAAADWRSRRAAAFGGPTLRLRELLAVLCRTQRIHAELARANGMHGAGGWDDVVHVRVATAAGAVAVLGGDRSQARAAISHAFLDGASLRPDAGAGACAVPRRDRWAVGDAASRGLRHALLALAGEPPADMDGVAAFGRLVLRQPLACAAFAARAAAAPPPHASPLELEVQHRLADAIAAHFSAKQSASIAALCADSAKLDDLAVHEFVSALVKN